MLVWEAMYFTLFSLYKLGRFVFGNQFHRISLFLEIRNMYVETKIGSKSNLNITSYYYFLDFIGNEGTV